MIKAKNFQITVIKEPDATDAEPINKIDYYTKDDIDKIKIYTYKFNEYCKNE